MSSDPEFVLRVEQQGLHSAPPPEVTTLYPLAETSSVPSHVRGAAGETDRRGTNGPALTDFDFWLCV